MLQDGDLCPPIHNNIVVSSYPQLCPLDSHLLHAITGGLLCCLGFYFYLDALYLTDEVLQTDALRELTIQEKTTILLRQVSRI